MTKFVETPEPGEVTQNFLDRLSDDWNKNDPFALKVGAYCEEIAMGMIHKMDRMFQNTLSSNPLSQAAILARVSTTTYIPRLAIPFHAIVRFTNLSTDKTVTYQSGDLFLSESELFYTLLNNIELAPGESTTAEVKQYYIEISEHVSDETSFQEYEIGDETVSDFEIKVDDNVWPNNNDIISVGVTTESFYTLFSMYGKLSAKFGNNVRGKIPNLGANIEIKKYHTAGQDGNLLEGSKLEEYNVLQTQQCSVEIESIIRQGFYRESPEDMLASIPFHEQNKGGLGWREGYKHTVRTGFPELIWLNWWNKKEHEDYNPKDVENTNRLFVSALLETNQANAGTLIVDYLNATHKPDVVRFTWVEPDLKLGVIAITGKVDSNINIPNAIAVIKNGLLEMYGQESKSKLSSLIESDIYGFLKEVETDGDLVFGDHVGDKSRVIRPSHSIVISGETEPSQLNDLIYVDEANISIVLESL